MRLYIIQREDHDASTSVTSLTFHIPSSLLIYVTPMSPYHPTASSTSCLYTNSTYTTSHSLVHLKHHLTQPRPILGMSSNNTCSCWHRPKALATPARPRSTEPGTPPPRRYPSHFHLETSLYEVANLFDFKGTRLDPKIKRRSCNRTYLTTTQLHSQFNCK